MNGRTRSTVRRDWALAALAPLTVVIGLVGLRNVWFVFAAYHLGICLAVPWLLARREGLALREHAGRLGLATRAGVAPGLILGGLAAALIPGSYLAAPGLYPAGEQLQGILTSWAIDPARPVLPLGFLLLGNGPAEELFWRGHLQGRLLRGPRSAAALVLLFASYHAVTVGRLAPGPGALAAMLAAVILGGAFWTYSRLRWRSVWPALLTHTGATAGYLAVCLHLLR